METENSKDGDTDTGIPLTEVITSQRDQLAKMDQPAKEDQQTDQAAETDNLSEKDQSTETVNLEPMAGAEERASSVAWVEPESVVYKVPKKTAPKTSRVIQVERSPYSQSAAKAIDGLMDSSASSQSSEKSETSETSRSEHKTPSQVLNELFQNDNEQKILETIHGAIHKGKDLNDLPTDNSGNTVLHRAVRRNFLCVAEKLLDYGIDPMAENDQAQIPLNVAIDNNYDEMAAMILSKLRKCVVRRLFGDREPITKRMSTESSDEEGIEPINSINTLIARGLTQTLMQVLDSFMEEQQNGLYDVYVKLLDTDDEGKEPASYGFNFKHYTAFQMLAKCNKKDALNHPVIRTFVEYKWGKWCKSTFLLHCCLYLFSLFSLSYSVVTGVTAPDVQSYDSRLQHSRAVFEVFSYLYAIGILFMGIRQLISKYKRQQFVLLYNWLELSSAILLMISLPLRYTRTEAHWYTFAVGYFLWAIRIFNYSKVSSKFGLYSEIIRRILVQDFAQFSVLFLVINTIFAGTFLLVLKGDECLGIHNETSSFQGIMYVGLRTLVEAAPIVDYSGSDGYRTAGTIAMLLFMFITIVVLLNILIAQISETYTRVHGDSVKTVRVNRARIVAHSERNEWHLLSRTSNRVKYYTSKIRDVDIKALEKKDDSEIEVLSANIAAIKKKQIKDGLEIQTVKTRQHSSNKRIADKIDEVFDRLEGIEKLLKPSGSNYL